MKLSQDKLSLKGITSVAAAAAFLMLSANTALAQGTRAPSPAELKSRENTIYDQDLQLRGAVNEKKVGGDQTRESNNSARQAMAQTIQDFDRIQAVDREFMIALMAKKEFDYKTLTNMMGEIRKLAKRLKDNMNLPPATKEKDQQRKWDEIGAAEMKDALVALDERIGSFVTNPLFQTSNWLDVQLGGKASRDLEVIIELSGQIKKGAERLSKPTP